MRKSYLLDVNVLIALVFPLLPHHRNALGVFQASSMSNPIFLCRAVQQGYLRLVTTPLIHRQYGVQPISNAQAWLDFQALGKVAYVKWLYEPPNLERDWGRLAGVTTPSPKMWMDAYLAAFALGHNLTLATLDQDFKRYSPAVDVEVLS